MIKKIEKSVFVNTEENIINKINEIIDVVNNMTLDDQKCLETIKEWAKKNNSKEG